LNLNKLWEDAVEVSLNYIESLVKLKELTHDEIKLLTAEQKSRLYKFYITLSEQKEENAVAEKPLISVNALAVKSYTMLDIIGTTLKVENTTVPVQFVESNYRNITIYKTKQTTMKYPLPNIKLGNEYTIDKEIVIPTVYTPETDSFICTKKETEDERVYHREEFRIKKSTLTLQRDPLFCTISNDDAMLLQDVPGYYWYIDTVDYDEPIKDIKIIKKPITEIKTFVPTCFITPSGMLNGKPLIERADIFAAIAYTGFSKLMTSDEYVYQIKQKVSATNAAIDFAIMNKIDINKMLTRIVGTIELDHVIEEYENANPRPSLSISALTKLIETAVNLRDFNTIAKNYSRAVKSKLPKELLRSARAVIDNKPKPEEKPKKYPDVKKPTIKTSNNSYVHASRR